LLGATAATGFWAWQYHVRHHPSVALQTPSSLMRIPCDQIRPPEPPHPRLP
jgi:hypothetical protein